MSIFALNNNVRVLVAGVIKATSAQRIAVSAQVVAPIRAPRQIIDVTIASGQAISPAIDLGNGRLVGILTPAVWTAADLTFQASLDGTNWFDLFDGSSDTVERKIEAGDTRLVHLDPTLWTAIQYVKVRSGTKATPVNQAAARTLRLVVER